MGLPKVSVSDFRSPDTVQLLITVTDTNQYQYLQSWNEHNTANLYCDAPLGAVHDAVSYEQAILFAAIPLDHFAETDLLICFVAV